MAHLGSVAVCIVDTSIVALVQPLKGKGEKSEKVQPYLGSQATHTHAPAKNMGHISSSQRAPHALS